MEGKFFRLAHGLAATGDVKKSVINGRNKKQVWHHFFEIGPVPHLRFAPPPPTADPGERRLHCLTACHPTGCRPHVPAPAQESYHHFGATEDRWSSSRRRIPPASLPLSNTTFGAKMDFRAIANKAFEKLRAANSVIALPAAKPESIC